MGLDEYIKKRDFSKTELFKGVLSKGINIEKALEKIGE